MKFRLNKVILPFEVASEKLGATFEVLDDVPVVGGFLKFLLVLLVLAIIGVLLLLGMAGFVGLALFLNNLATGG